VTLVTPIALTRIGLPRASTAKLHGARIVGSVLLDASQSDSAPVAGRRSRPGLPLASFLPTVDWWPGYLPARGAGETCHSDDRPPEDSRRLASVARVDEWRASRA
jgi:hypothetical protein